MTVTDLRGRQLHLPERPTRIVCLIESALSGLYMLGAGERVIAVSRNVYEGENADWYGRIDPRLAARALPTPGNWDFVSLEAVLALCPDLVIIWSEHSETIAALEARGIPVFGVFIAGLADLEQEMLALGQVTGRETRAAELIAASRAALVEVADRVAVPPPQPRPSVYFMWAQGRLETSCGGSMVDAVITAAGGRNVCGHLPAEHRTVNLEQLIAWDPDLILMWPNPALTPAALRADRQLQALRAVREGRVYALPSPFLCDLWTLKLPYAVRQLAAWLYPSRFEVWDAGQVGNAILRDLYGIDG